MDFNYLYQRHQVSLYLAEHAASDEARQAHREFAKGYAARIAVGKQAGAAPVAA